MAIAVTNSKRDTKWFERLTVADQELGREKAKWRRNRALLLGLPPTGVTDWSEVNLAWAAFETLVGACYGRMPDGIVRETKAETANVAKILTSTAKADFEAMRLRYFTRLAILDVFWAGYGFIMEKMTGDPSLAVHRFIEQDEKGEATESEYATPTLKNQAYAFYRCHPASILRDPLGTMPDGSDFGWLSFDYYPTVKELREDYGVSKSLLDKLPKLRQNPYRESSIDYSRPSGLPGEQVDEEDDEFAQVCCREIWDRVNRKVIYIPKHTDTVIESKDWPVELRYNKQLRFPGVFLYFNEAPDSSYPIAEISTAARQLEQFATLYRQILRDSVTKWRKGIYRADMFDQAQINKIIKEPGTSLIPIRSNQIGDPTKLDIAKSAIVMLPDPVVKQDQIAVLNIVKGLIHEIFGAGDFASAGFRNTRSATEAAQLSDFLRSRMTTRTENLDAFHREVLTNHVLFLQQTMTEDRVAEIVSPEGVVTWQNYRREDIQGDFKFTIIAGSSTPLNTETHRQESMGFFQQAIGPVMQTGGSVEPLIRWAAPLFHMPEHLVDQIYQGHRQALMKVGTMVAQTYMGQKPQPQQFIEAVAAAVNTGLSVADQQLIAQAVQQMAQQPQQPGGGAPAAQPGGLPGTNPSDQTLPS